jgi:Histone chaperone Rttp106-like
MSRHLGAARTVSHTSRERPKPTQLSLVTTLIYFQLGFLFFLPTGILWAFKKPLLFFAFDVIESTSYTSVLQRTFNLNVATRASDNTQEFEFSMIDQADFSGIDAYVRGHGLQDASMAEQRRAKKLNVNGTTVGKSEVGEAREGDEGEIAKAVREMEDEEDEEEDYDPGSEEDSEGSGTDSEEEDGQEEGSDDEEKDLIEEELGSEAEDVGDGE